MRSIPIAKPVCQYDRGLFADGKWCKVFNLYLVELLADSIRRKASIATSTFTSVFV